MPSSNLYDLSLSMQHEIFALHSRPPHWKVLMTHFFKTQADKDLNTLTIYDSFMYFIYNHLQLTQRLRMSGAIILTSLSFITWTGTLTLSNSHTNLFYFAFAHSMLDN